ARRIAAFAERRRWPGPRRVSDSGEVMFIKATPSRPPSELGPWDKSAQNHPETVLVTPRYPARGRVIAEDNGQGVPESTQGRASVRIVPEVFLLSRVGCQIVKLFRPLDVQKVL